ncbi:hypothetical protein SAMN04488113_1221, partial [Alkalibacterium gilvum]
MNKIISKIIKILKEQDTLLEAELALEILFQQIVQELLCAAFKQIDLELIQEYKDQGYEIDSIQKRTIQWTFGVIEFS